MPSTGNFILDKGYDADGVIVKYRAVKAGANAESVQACNAKGETGLGIAQFDVTTADLTHGKGASVRRQGATEWEVGGAIQRHQHVTCDNTGKCIVAAVGDVVWGEAEQTSDGSAGSRIRVTLAPVKMTAEVVS
jgi:hypothetical protein